MTVAIHDTGNQMYLLFDPDRNGFLIWMHGDEKYIMTFSDAEKAEQYNHVVMRHRSAEVVLIKRRDSKDFAKKMVARNVFWMIIDYPVINDQDFWDEHPYEIGKIPKEHGRNYSIVDLRKLVKTM